MMGNAIWLAVAVPRWFFEGALRPFSAGILSLIVFIGTVCLLIGAICGLIQRHKKLLLFLLPLIASEILVIISGFYRGQVPSGGGKWMLVFLVTEALMAGFLVYRLKGARVSASFLAIFCVAYAWFASFVAGMSFSNIWL